MERGSTVSAGGGLLDVGTTQVVVVDVQARLAPAMPTAARARAFAALHLLAAATEALGVPVTLTEHVPERIGATVPEIAQAFADAGTVGKVHFSAARAPALRERLAGFDRPRVLVAGMETHVCVLQTALGLQAAGYAVDLVVDACCARAPLDEEIAFRRAEAAGLGLVTSEMAAFEWLRRADHPARRSIIDAVKAKDAAAI
jgi:nicotinamidase-related amidase